MSEMKKLKKRKKQSPSISEIVAKAYSSKKNKQDATLRNVRAANKRIKALETEVKFLKSIILPFAFEKYVKLVTAKRGRK